MSNISGASLMERKRSQLNESDSASRRSSLPTRLRTNSLTGSSEKSPTTPWSAKSQQPPPPQQQQQQQPASPLPASAELATDEEGGTNAEGSEDSPLQLTGASVVSETAPATSDAITCLIAEDNPISLKMLESILVKLGCQVSSVRNGAEALRLAMAETKFAVLFIDVTLPIVNGQDVARMIKSTRNISSVTPIIALASFDAASLDVTGSVFDAVLAKPVEKSDVCNILPRFGFKPLMVTSRVSSGAGGMANARRSTVAGLE